MVDQFPTSQIVVVDKEYVLPTLEEFDAILGKSFIRNYKYTVDKFDCDDFSCILEAYVKQQKYVDDVSYQYPIGRVYGVLAGVEGFHSRNLVICGNSVEDAKNYSVEPQTYEVRLYGYQDYLGYIII